MGKYDVEVVTADFEMGMTLLLLQYIALPVGETNA